MRLFDILGGYRIGGITYDYSGTHHIINHRYNCGNRGYTMNLHTYKEFEQYFNRLAAKLKSKGKAEDVIAYTIGVSSSAIKKTRRTKVITQTTLAAIRCAILEGRLPK